MQIKPMIVLSTDKKFEIIIVVLNEEKYVDRWIREATLGEKTAVRDVGTNNQLMCLNSKSN